MRWRKVRIGVVAGVMLVLAAGCAGAPPAVAAAASTRPVLKPRKDLKGLPNFAQVSENLYRGGQPTAQGFAVLKQMGIKTVVSLRSGHSDRALLKGTGLRYVRFASKAWRPDEDNVVKFLKVVEDRENWPIFVHCQAGADRTGLMVAVYRVVHEGWTAEEAMGELPRFGYHAVFTEIKSYLGEFEPSPVQAKVAAAPKPKIGVVK